MPGSVLVVDDDAVVSGVVVDYLRRAGFTAHSVADGGRGLAAAREHRPDLVVLDVMLPGVDGIEVCRALRAEVATAATPVILLTALGQEDDRVLGLEVGADDYVTKPFSPRELVLRVESVLRRVRGGPVASAADVTSGGVVVSPSSRRVHVRGAEVSLTAREFDLLAFLVAHPGQAFKREELLERVWGWSFGDRSTVTVHVRRLREKVEADPAAPVLLETVWGVGYRWAATP
ncbi:DNA-binding response OmpR family regulator [Motilibacter peucedani]|uniref:DNA-binding response OmpR family regulator n=1 Tax=Motilibacter peucedani TaxID=598650 RepID=A0A420XNC3_9ACTN|nr:response regulator transcription factor [Motilibacter peucedani]RKS72776.1 DNA-binding response OmpR family regulator [Motilibacter peucedani]